MISWGRWRTALLLAAILAAGLALRGPRLGSVPNGLIPDEALSGYDAYSLLRTGHDQFGEAWPLFPKSTARLHALYLYLSLPAVAALGLNELSVRLPAVLLGMAQILLIYLLMRELGHPRAGLYAAAVLGISPWHVLMSRTGYDWIALPVMSTLVVWLLVRALNGRGGWLWAGCAVGLAFYAYAPVRLLLPLLLAGTAWVFRRRVGSQWRGLLAAGAVAALIAWPVAAAMLSPEGMDRLGAVQQQGTTAWETIAGLASRYLRSFTPRFWLAGAEAGELHRLRSVGLLYGFEACLALAGIVRALMRRSIGDRLALFWLLAAPLSVAIHRDCPDPILQLTSLPAPQLLAGLGADWVLALSCRRWVRQALAATLAVAVAVCAARMVTDLYWDYPRYSAAAWAHGARETVRLAESLRGGYDDVIVDGRDKLIFSLILFYTRYDPALRQREIQSLSGRSYRSRVGPYRIGDVVELAQEPGRHLIWTTIGDARRFFPRSRPLQIIRWPDGRGHYALLTASNDSKAGPTRPGPR